MRLRVYDVSTLKNIGNVLYTCSERQVNPNSGHRRKENLNIVFLLYKSKF